MKKSQFILIILFALILAPHIFGQVPHIMNYQGRLLTGSGEPVPDDVYDITFSIYNDPVTVDHLWQETLSVEVSGGFFHVNLGDVAPFEDLFFANGPELLLGIKIGSDPELSPRTSITASGFALHSELADISHLALNVEPNTLTGEHIVDGTLGLEEINQSGALEGQVPKWLEGTWVPADDEGGGGLELPYSGAVPTAADAFSIFNAGSGVAVRGQSDGNDGVVGWTADSSMSGVYGYSSTGIGVTGRSEGYNHGVYGETGSCNLNDAGVRGVSLCDAPGVSGYGPAIGIYGSSPSVAGRFDGFVGINGFQATANDTGTAAFFESEHMTLDDTAVVYIKYDGDSDPNLGMPTALTAKCFDPNNRSVGGYFVASGIGLLSISADTLDNHSNHGLITRIGYGGRNVGVDVWTLFDPIRPQPADNFGAWLESHDAEYNFGLLARAGDEYLTPHKPKYNYGVYAEGTEADSMGIGVYGYAYDCDSTIGMYASAFGGNVNIGLYAKAPSGPNDWAGYFDGDVHVTGNLSATSKSFRMDHPQDPANKYLSHACMESSEMLNVYSGTIVLDGNGEAAVALPDYFEDINKDFRYQLTAIGAPGPNLYIAEEINNNSFKIAGGNPGMKVSWEVTGVRNDPYAQAHPMQVEIEKNDREKGKYLHPEAYGLDESYGIHTSARREFPERDEPDWLEDIGKR
ncbi:MAG TPA: hypothetical protein ENO22_11205 [candidate division Zixibacteria bacterium]|nr:hypothetical protein [candidate division Zixibacteria bacterium]HEQ99894.1 hypothetical protein [candidate division Zixibacteria bacterium]